MKKPLSLISLALIAVLLTSCSTQSNSANVNSSTTTAVPTTSAVTTAKTTVETTIVTTTEVTEETSTKATTETTTEATEVTTIETTSNEAEDENLKEIDDTYTCRLLKITCDLYINYIALFTTISDVSDMLPYIGSLGYSYESYYLQLLETLQPCLDEIDNAVSNLDTLDVPSTYSLDHIYVKSQAEDVQTSAHSLMEVLKLSCLDDSPSESDIEYYSSQIIQTVDAKNPLDTAWSVKSHYFANLETTDYPIYTLPVEAYIYLKMLHIHNYFMNTQSQKGDSEGVMALYDDALENAMPYYEQLKSDMEYFDSFSKYNNQFEKVEIATDNFKNYFEQCRSYGYIDYDSSYYESISQSVVDFVDSVTSDNEPLPEN